MSKYEIPFLTACIHARLFGGTAMLITYELDEAALERVYTSPLMPALQGEEGELYVQSPAYLYELMGQLPSPSMISSTGLPKMN